MKDYLDKVCPKTTVLDHEALIFSLPSNYSAGTLVNAWVELLNSTPERCVEIKKVVFSIEQTVMLLGMCRYTLKGHFTA